MVICLLDVIKFTARWEICNQAYAWSSTLVIFSHPTAHDGRSNLNHGHRALLEDLRRRDGFNERSLRVASLHQALAHAAVVLQAETLVLTFE